MEPEPNNNSDRLIIVILDTTITYKFTGVLIDWEPNTYKLFS